MEVRQALLWSALLLSGQTTDTITTGIDRARGALEAMPVTGQLLGAGGITLLWGIKLLLVMVAAAVLYMAARAVRPGHRLSLLTYRVALFSVQVATVGLVWVSLSNAMLLGSLTT